MKPQLIISAMLMSRSSFATEYKVYKGQILVDETYKKQKPIITDGVAYVASHFTIEFKL